MDDFIIRKIKTLRKIKPDTSWLISQRSFLLSEISRLQEKERKPSLVLPLFNFNILKIFKPAFAIALLIIILISSLATVGVISASQNSLPGDLLYPVKTALEKTQYTFTAGSESRTKLSIKFATQRIDEFTRLIDKSEKKEEIEKTVKKFTQELVTVQQEINALKEKNTQKAAKVAKLIQAQTPVYEEMLINSTEKLGYILPSEKEELKENINQALEEVNKTKEVTEEIMGNEELNPIQENPIEENNPEEIIVPEIKENIESQSMPFENIQPPVEKVE